jgi:spore coat polysaccharide biosynthesis predicted glycosyltransferase SpsG
MRDRIELTDGVWLVAEAGREIGWGHLAEMRAVASALEARGVASTRIVTGPDDVHGTDVEWLPDHASLIARIVDVRPAVVGWNMRTNGWRDAWYLLEGSPTRHLWIDDIADDYPEVDVLVIPRLDPPNRVAHPGPRVFGGAAYFPLDVRGSRVVPPLHERPREVLLTLGGSDPTEASLRLAPMLAGTRSTVVIGPGFRHRDELLRVAASARLDVAVAPDGLRDLLVAHRLVISAGGDTLFEAAAAGTPALVTWTNPSEESQGAAFASRGTARVLGRGIEVDPGSVAREVRSLLAADTLNAMSAAGPGVVDSGGADRNAELLLELVNGDAA